MKEEGRVFRLLSTSISPGELPALFFDFDGTLSEIARTPDEAVLYPGVREILEGLSKREDMVGGVISGRSLSDIKDRVDVPGLVYSGNHGMEVEVAGKIFTLIGGDVKGEVASFSNLVRGKVGGISGVFIEDKTLSLSIHVRSVEVESIPMVKSRILEALVGFENLVLREGKKVFEVLPKDSTTKGDALEAILRKIASDRNIKLYPVYFGDDMTDKHVYDFLRKHGKGITVFVQGRDPVYLDADLVLGGPGEVLKEITFLVHGTY